MSPSPRKPTPLKAPSALKPPKGLSRVLRLPKTRGIKPIPGIKPIKPLPGPQSIAPSEPADPEVLATIQEAIDGRLQVLAMYVDENGVTDVHTFFPVDLGAKRREHRTWAYQTAGGSGVGWRCFVVGRLSNVTTQRAEWTVPEKAASSAKCMDQERTPTP